MENPWKTLPKEAPYVIPNEARIINEFKLRCTKPEHMLQTHVLPEPFIGNPNSSVYLLSLNPGFSPDDPKWHSREDFSGAIWANLLHELNDYPFYFLNPKFHDSPGSDWWLQRLNPLIQDTSHETVSNNIFCVEFFGYHSEEYKKIPKSITTSPLPSQRYAAFLVRQAMKRNVKIVVMRSIKKWIGNVPELKKYKYLYEVKNYRRPFVSKKNLIRYHEIVEEFI